MLDLKSLYQLIDKRVDRIVTQGFPRHLRSTVVGALAVFIVLITWLHWLGGDQLEINVYFVAVGLACFFFRQRGLWTIPICLVLFDLTLGPQGRLMPDMLFRSLVELSKWGFLACFILVTLSRYDRARTYHTILQQDMSLARTLQRALMPRHFESASVRVDARIHQARQIGGDFYYFRPFKEKYVVIGLGDIMGKGIPASMVMAIVMGFFYEWGKTSFSPAFLMERLNERLYSLWSEEESWFVTMFSAIYDEETHELKYSSGGHQPALLLRGDQRKEIERLTTEGLPVGIFEEVPWDEKSVILEPGDRVVVFTDGVNEARSPLGEMFGVERLEEAVRALRHLPPGDIARGVIKRVRDHACSDNLDDDVAILVLEVKE